MESLRERLLADPLARQRPSKEARIVRIERRPDDHETDIQWSPHSRSARVARDGYPAQSLDLQELEESLDVSPVIESADFLLLAAVVDRTPTNVTVATYSFPKVSWEEWWASVENSFDPSAVSTVASELTSPEHSVVSELDTKPESSPAVCDGG